MRAGGGGALAPEVVLDAVAGGGVLAGLLVGVRDEVGKRIRLDDERDGGVGVLLEDGDDGGDGGSDGGRARR